MSPPPLTAAPPPARSAADGLAYALTYLVSPLSLPLLVAYLGARALGGGAGEARTAALVALVGNGLIPLIALVALLWSGRVASLEIRERRRRTLPYLLGTFGTLVSAAGLWHWLPGGRVLLAEATAWQAVNALVLLAVNQRTKVSVHLYALASGTAFLAYLRLRGGSVSGATMLLLLVLIPVLAWSRVRLRAHTWGQVGLGLALGALLLPLELWLIALATDP